MTKDDKENRKTHSRPYEEYSERTGYPVVKKPRKKFKLDSIRFSQFPWAWVCVACLLIALLLVILYPVFQQTQKSQTILALEKRIAGIERRLDMDQGQSLLAKRIENLESDINNLRQRLMMLSKSIEPAKAARPPGKAGPLSSKSRELPNGAASPQYHEVEPGETLFRIGRQYGVSVDDLRKFNKLSEDEMIHPGQKLIVSPP